MKLSKKDIRSLVEITRKMINFKTPAPIGNEYLCKNYILKLMDDIGMSARIVAKNPKRINIIGEYGNGKQTLALACHIDTVAAGEGWNNNPYKAVVKNGRIIGRGAIDNKGPLAITYTAIRKFIEHFPNFDGKIVFVALADEETDNIFGIKHLLEKKTLEGVNSALIPDGGYFNKLEIGEMGCVQVEIKSLGKAAHSALVKKPQNAIKNLANLIIKLYLINWSSNYNKNFQKTRVNISIINGGGIPNSVPSYASAQLDIRYPLGIRSNDIINKLSSVIKQESGKFKVNIVYTTEPHYVTNKKLIDSFISAASNLKIKMDKITIAGNSVAKEFNLAGIPAIVHYPMEKITAHEPNEYIDISQMEKTTELYYEFLKT